MDRVLTEVLGETGASFIFNHLKQRRSLEKERIPMEIEKFRNVIVEMLGSGGLVLLNRIVEELAAELGVEAPRYGNLRFEEKLEVLGGSYA